VLGALAVLPVYAQDTPAADTAPPAADAAPADAASTPDSAATPAPAEAPPAEAAVPADTAPATAEAPAASDTPPADAAAAIPAEPAPADAAATPADTAAPAADATAAAETAAADASPRKPLNLYVGYDYVHTNFLASNPNSPPTPNSTSQFGTNNLGSKFHQVRAGLRLFDVIGLEAHYGIKVGDGVKPDTIATSNYAGLYFVPTGTLFETVEISALLGYARMSLEQPGASLSVHGSSYGANLELPLRRLSESLPDIRIGGGVMVYHHDTESRIYGTHFGIRYDFRI
jgi:hypothetical protein